MTDHARPSIVSKRTHVRQKKHAAAAAAAPLPANLPAAPSTLERILVGLGCCGLGYYLITNQKRFSPYELAGISVGSLALGLGVFDLGRRRGVSEGAGFALRSGDERKEGEEEDDWRGEFKGREYADLKTEDKVSWLRKEEKKIRDMQAQEKFRCGQAYIAKEEAYAAYEKHGGYGGQDWKKYAFLFAFLSSQAGYV
jgi:hypothetical protein